MDKLNPIIMTQGEIPWNPRASKHNDCIGTSFKDEVQEKLQEDLDLDNDHTVQGIRSLPN